MTLSSTQSPIAREKPNILFIAIDDLNDWVTSYQGHPQVQTPNIDRLATKGIRFTSAYCQAPICAPSRNSLLTGVLPSSSGLYFLKPLSIRETETLKDAVTLPQYFLQHGYKTMAAGKIFHGNDSLSFPEYGGDFGALGPYPKEKISYPKSSRNVDWGKVSFPDEEFPDYQIAEWTVKQLSKKHDKPFFLGCGFYRPHVPWYASERWFDLYPLDSVKLPEVLSYDREDISEYAKKLTYSAAAPRHSWIIDHNAWKPSVQAYMACISFVDSCVGRVLDALEASDYAENTLVVLWSDHGYHLGEKLRWAKRSLWEESTKVPLIMAGPDIPYGEVRHQPVGLIDLYPTLVDYGGLPEKEGLEGSSLVQIIRDPEMVREKPVITTFGPDNHALRSQRWRYIQYADGSEELYDHENDPYEWYNLAGKPEYEEIIAMHAQWIPEWSVPMVKGSADSDSPLYDPKIVYQEE